jgi:hypothetical protein
MHQWQTAIFGSGEVETLKRITLHFDKPSSYDVLVDRKDNCCMMRSMDIIIILLLLEYVVVVIDDGV